MIDESNIINCTNTGTVSYGTIVTSTLGVQGGIVGLSYSSEVKKCKNIGTIKYNMAANRMIEGGIGGICGYAAEGTKVEQSFNTGSIISKNESNYRNANGLGGIAGVVCTATIENCYNLGNVEGNYKVGGIVGAMGVKFKTEKSYLYNCYNGNCSITGNAEVGELIGIGENVTGNVLAWIKGKLSSGTQADCVWGNDWSEYTESEMKSMSLYRINDKRKR